MRIVLIAALTADGFIGKSADHLADWSSKADKALFVRVTKELGTMVMGANTFATIGRTLPGRTTIVMTHHPERIMAEGVLTTSETPTELVARLKTSGCQGLAVCGGANVYRQFMAAGLVAEMYLVTEPILFGQGIGLLDTALETRLKLLESQVVESTVLNHYKVIKP